MKTIYPSSTGAMITSGVEPGDVIMLQAANRYTYLYLGKLNGTKDNPIVVKTDGLGIVTMTAGISIENCTYIRVDGGGLQIRIVATPNSGVPLTVKGKCSHIEVSGIEASGGIGGFWVKTEVSDVQNAYGCDTSYLYPTRFDDIHIYSCYLHDIGGDGFYLGSTDPYGGGREMNCGGVITKPRPMGLSNVVIHNNRFEKIGRTAIQLSGCDEGVNKIYDNDITDAGLENLVKVKSSLPNLKTIYLNYSKTTRQGETNFRAAWGTPINVIF